MADMGNYSMWPIFMALDLPVPSSVEAQSSSSAEINDQVRHHQGERLLISVRQPGASSSQRTACGSRSTVLVRRRHAAIHPEVLSAEESPFRRGHAVRRRRRE